MVFPCSDGLGPLKMNEVLMFLTWVMQTWLLARVWLRFAILGSANEASRMRLAEVCRLNGASHTANTILMELLDFSTWQTRWKHNLCTNVCLSTLRAEVQHAFFEQTVVLTAGIRVGTTVGRARAVFSPHRGGYARSAHTDPPRWLCHLCRRVK